MDDNDMVAAIAEVTEVWEAPQPDWEALASSENVGSTWFMRDSWRLRSSLPPSSPSQEERVIGHSTTGSGNLDELGGCSRPCQV